MTSGRNSQRVLATKLSSSGSMGNASVCV
jgi:hypothetical protein